MLTPIDKLLTNHAEPALFERVAREFETLWPVFFVVYDLDGRKFWPAHNPTARTPEVLDALPGGHALREKVAARRDVVCVEEDGHTTGCLGPLTLEEGCVGYVALFAAETGVSLGSFDDPGRLEEILRLCGGLLSDGIVGRRTIQDITSDLAARYEELSLVYTLTDALDLSQDPDTALQLIFTAVASTLGADAVVIDVPVLNFRRSYPAVVGDRPTVDALVRALMSDVQRQGHSIAINRLETDPIWSPYAGDYHNAAAVGLDIDRDPGVLVFLQQGQEKQLLMSDVKMLEAVCRQVSIFMTNHRIDQARRQLFDLTIFGLARLAESRDTETGEHLERTSRYCQLLGQCLLANGADGIDAAFADTIFRSSPLHDIGKVGIPDNILNKPGKLTAEEFELMKQHAVIGGDTLRDIEERLNWGESTFLSMGREIAYSHHEKWDGSGYPHGIKGEAIPLSARIMAMADVYDALTTKRCYKPAFEHARARDIILEGDGQHFDPMLVRAFLEVEERFIAVRESLSGRPAGLAARLMAERERLS